jgi:hypothetical protein
MVLGTSDILGSNRDLPAGDQVSRAEHCDCHDLLGDICDWPDLPCNVVPLHVRDILPLGGWVCLMTTLFAHFFLPETKKLPMEQVWRRHIMTSGGVSIYNGET